MDYLLVAERSLQVTLPVTLESLRRHGRPDSIAVLVPQRDLALFAPLTQGCVRVVSEDQVLPDWPLARVRAALRQPERAGWYLQQFLKLSWDGPSGLGRYLIWDADTVMLRTPVFEQNGRTVVALAREHHRPYFDTYQRILGRQPSLKRSAISQYLLVHADLLQQLRAAICAHTGRSDWIEAVLANLPGLDPSEFSEYETYVNLLQATHPERLEQRRTRWFRYGAETFDPRAGEPATATLDRIERSFRAFAYVAFERHPSGPVKRWLACLLKAARVGS